MAKQNAKPAAKAGRSTTGKPDRWFAPAKPDYIKLVVGEVVTGVYLSTQDSRYGPVYRFQDGQVIKAVSGNRVALDTIMEQVEAASMRGHLLCLERLPDSESNSGRRVHQYRVGHISDGCPKCDSSNVPAGFTKA